MNGQPKREVIADHKWWKELENFLPWKLYGWSFRHGATFFTQDDCGKYSIPLELTGKQRDEILTAIHTAEVRGGK